MASRFSQLAVFDNHISNRFCAAFKLSVSQFVVFVLCLGAFRRGEPRLSELDRLVQNPIAPESGAFHPANAQVHGRFRSFAGLAANRARNTCTYEAPCNFLMISDLDQESKVSDAPLLFKSYLYRGRQRFVGFRLYTTPKGDYAVEFHQNGPEEVFGKLNEGGRGLELSELVNFRGQLLTFDDRTGAVFEILSSVPKDHGETAAAPEYTLVPRAIISEGDGFSPKGTKIEWATEKDGVLFIGSFGKEYTDNTGFNVVSNSNMWVAVMDSLGRFERRNWTPIYELLRARLNVTFPGYLLHEAINWSSHLRKWVVLPRRLSHEPYNEVIDEKKGTNVLLLASENFAKIDVVHVGVINPLRGYSSFKFVPGTGDKIILAIKSLEEGAVQRQETYISVFETLTGTVLVEDILVPHQAKYEGLEFF